MLLNLLGHSLFVYSVVVCLQGVCMYYCACVLFTGCDCVCVKEGFSTHIWMWSLMRSKTMMLLLTLAKYMAVFLCLEVMLQSAPYSSSRRTTSALPLLHAWEG